MHARARSRAHTHTHTHIQERRGKGRGHKQQKLFDEGCLFRRGSGGWVVGGFVIRISSLIMICEINTSSYVTKEEFEVITIPTHN